jgi:DNA-binding transcriptional regulator YiaG
MANIQQMLNEEIRRLARKEVIALEKELKSQLIELRKTVAVQNRRIKELEKALTMQSAPAKDNEPAAEEEVKSFRITPERIIKWRQSMGLKRAQYARLLGVSPLSVAHWEQGSSTPREAQKKRIAELRDMGKRELTKLCAEKSIKLKLAPGKDNE